MREEEVLPRRWLLRAGHELNQANAPLRKAQATGRIRRRVYTSKLSTEQIVALRARWVAGDRIVDIASAFSVTPRAVRKRCKDLPARPRRKGKARGHLLRLLQGPLPALRHEFAERILEAAAEMFEVGVDRLRIPGGRGRPVDQAPRARKVVLHALRMGFVEMETCAEVLGLSVDCAQRLYRRGFSEEDVRRDAREVLAAARGERRQEAA